MFRLFKPSFLVLSLSAACTADMSPAGRLSLNQSAGSCGANVNEVSGTVSFVSTCYNGMYARPVAVATRSFNRFCQTMFNYIDAKAEKQISDSSNAPNFFEAALNLDNVPKYALRSSFCLQMARRLVSNFTEDEFEALSITFVAMTEMLESFAQTRRDVTRDDADEVFAYLAPELIESLQQKSLVDFRERFGLFWEDAVPKSFADAYTNLVMGALNTALKNNRVEEIGKANVLSKNKIRDLKGDFYEAAIQASSGGQVYRIRQNNLDDTRIDEKYFGVGAEVFLIRNYSNGYVFAFPLPADSFFTDVIESISDLDIADRTGRTY